MRNLKSYGVKELKANELKFIDGGVFFLLLIMYGDRIGDGLERSGFNSAGANK